jgi:GT2 family glycosyltransferase
MGAFRTAVNAVGGFDERLGPGTAFPAAEDNDLGFRLLESGYQIRYVPQATLYHRAWRTGREQIATGWRYGVGRGAYYAKHIRRQDRYMLTRMASDLRVNVMDAMGGLRRRGRLNLSDLLTAGGILYGALRWRATGAGRSLP